MNCRRCSTHRGVAHYRNDLFDGWFCPRCVDEMVNADVQSSRVPPANETGSPVDSEGAGSDQRRGLSRRSAPHA